MEGTHGQCSWLYCVAASSDAAVPVGLAGVAGEPIEEVDAHQLTAFAGSVPEAEYGLDALRHNLEDLDWLADCAAAHHQVISDIAATRAVTPMRLATICRDTRGVADLLGRRAEELRSSIEHVTGRAEWGLKAYLCAPPADAAAAGSADNSGASTSPGTAYLARRRQAVASREEARQEACGSAERLISTVDSMAVDARDHQLHDASLDQAAADMIVNRSYLVDDRESADFSTAVDDLGTEFPGLRVELTGPWPVYSFAIGEQEPAS